MEWNQEQNKKVSSTERHYEKDYMKIEFNSDYDLPRKKPSKFNNITIAIRSAFEEYGKLYLEVFLDDVLYELSIKNCQNMTELIFWKD